MTRNQTENCGYINQGTHGRTAYLNEKEDELFSNADTLFLSDVNLPTIKP